MIGNLPFVKTKGVQRDSGCTENVGHLVVERNLVDAKPGHDRVQQDRTASASFAIVLLMPRHFFPSIMARNESMNRELSKRF